MFRWIGTFAFLLAIEFFAFGPLGAVRMAGAVLRSPMKPGVVRAAVLSPAPPPQGTTPTGLASGTPHSVTLTWNASTCTGCTITGYNVYRANATGGEAGTAALNGATPVTGATYTDTAVSSGQTWFYVVAAAYTPTGATDVEQSGFSNEASATIPGATNPTGCNAKAQ